MIGRSTVTCRLCLPLASVWLLGAPPALADPAALLGRLGRRGASTRRLEVSFTQRKRLALFSTEVVTKGRFIYQRPGRIRWETFAPDASVVLIGDDRVELRAPGQPAKRLPLARSPVLGALVGDLFVWLGVRGAEGIERRYRIEPGVSSAPGRLALVPRDPALAKRLRRIELWISDKGDVRRIRLLEPDGDATTIELSSPRRDRIAPRDAR